MSKKVRRDSRAGQMGNLCGGAPDGTTHHMGCAEASEPSTMGAHEDRLARVVRDASLFAQRFKRSCQIRGQWKKPFLATFPAQ